MSKKVFLSISAFLNFGMLVFCGYMAIDTWMFIQSGKNATANSGFEALAAALVLVIFGIASVILLVTLILKLISVKVQHNLMTFLAMLFDIVVVGLTISVSEDALKEIVAGNVAENIVCLAVLAVASLPLICDLISFPLQSSK